jgi:hypothetical protein
MNRKKILRAVGLLSVLVLFTASMRDIAHPPPREFVLAPDVPACQITYPAGVHPAPGVIPKGSLITSGCLGAR